VEARRLDLLEGKMLASAADQRKKNGVMEQWSDVPKKTILLYSNTPFIIILSPGAYPSTLELCLTQTVVVR
jgi:hypothetical protein